MASTPATGKDVQLMPSGPPSKYPPYPPYESDAAPPSLAEAIYAGHDLRLKRKTPPMKPANPPPLPARPRGPKATDVKMKRRAMRAHAACLRKHGAVLTDRLERMSKPLRRNIINMWRERAYMLAPETIARLRAMLDADEPFKPDQAYEYFVNLKKTKKKSTATARVKEIKKDILAMCEEKRFVWARNATIAFARGIQQRLSRPGHFALADGMARLSNIILNEICGYMHMKTPSRRSTNPKAKFMMEMSDKVAVWIDEILSESDDRMLMMDFDEDEEVRQYFEDEDQPESGSPSPAGAASPTLSAASKPDEATGNQAESPTATGDSAAATPGDSSAPTPGDTAAATPGDSTAVTPADTTAPTPTETVEQSAASSPKPSEPEVKK